jgi:hypothetical protein
VSAARKKRAQQCSRADCKAPAAKGRGGKCSAHYIADYRGGVRLVEHEDLGPNPGRLDYEAPRELVERFHQAVPKSERGKVLRRALEAELQRMSEETT